MPSGSAPSFVATAALVVALQAQASAARAADIINVYLDQAKIIEIPEATATVVIGNPLFVDAAMLKSGGKLVLTGKGYGETNLVTLDKNGAAVSELIVRVQPGERSLIVQRGAERESYTCNPRCQPVVSLGDSTRFMGETSGQIVTRNAAANAGAPR
jgi:hypothetical protein